MNSVYILSGTRTPQGSFLGSLSSVSAPKLGAITIKKSIEKAQIDPSEINEVMMGNVLTGGVGQAPARQAALYAELPESVPCTTINKVCGSGMQAVIFGMGQILTNQANCVVAGGMENMSLAPHLLNGQRKGHKFGDWKMLDSMQWDGLTDPYTGNAMGLCAEECVKKFKFTRQEQDEYSTNSFKRAQKAQTEGLFEDEIAPVLIKGRKGDIIVQEDEGPSKVNFEKMGKLPSAFCKDGTITAANASSINDGAASLVLGNESYRDKAKFKILGHAGHAQNPTWFTTAPAQAMKKCLERTRLKQEDIGVFEINEAFAAVSMATIKELNLDYEKVNIYGGAVSLGHPIGCSGARILVTLMNAMKNIGCRYGMASICIGGGEALAMILEQL